jgi:Asp-tRNA(Asn)/Glu-tRNA(Gln) amidotransferase A subunit family amidase
MPADQICYGTIAETVHGIRERQFSPVEVAGEHLDRIAMTHPRLNAFVHADADEPRKQARAAEEAVMRGDALRPLHGIPLTVKSCIDVAGWPAAAGSLMRKGYVAAADAPLVARLKAAGAIILGTTNTPEYLMAYETDNSLSGKTSNPWDLARSAGGSSGGEAAAIAAGCSIGGVGSDAGGSVRVPAHFCGICALKPTPGRIPSTGHFPPGGGAFGWLGVVGPMARTVADVRILFEVLAGPDAGEPCSAPVPLRAVSESDLRTVRIGVLESEAFGSRGLYAAANSVTPETKEAVERAAKILSERGFAVETKKLSGLDRTLELWWYFFGPVIGDIVRQAALGQEKLLSPMLSEFVAITTAEKEMNYDEFLHACSERDQVRAEILRQMEDVDVLLSPVSSGPAFRHGEGNWRRGEKECYLDTMRFSQWLNLAGLPGAAVPMGFSKEGLPLGVQVIGRPWEEELVLAVAEQLEKGRGEWQRPPL